MDSQELSHNNNNNNKSYLILRWCIVLLFPIIAFSSLSLLLILATVFVSNPNPSASSPISVSSQCRIVSSSVDLKSSKVCELGLLNYKAKHVFYPLEGRRFRCSYDYYWASVFKVEYQDQSSGQTWVAVAEAPSEALPLNCRPNFGAAWLTKDRFKVNKTYDCWYTYGVSQVSLYDDGFFSCQAKDPSTFEMIRRYSTLSTKILHTWLLSQEPAMYWRWETLVGVVTGFSTALILITFLKLMQVLKSQIPQISARRMLTQSISAVLFRRTCFFIAYISFMGWLAIEYGKRLGLPELLTLLRK